MFSIFLLVILCFSSLIGSYSPQGNSQKEESKVSIPSEPKDGFTIEAYNVILNVGLDNKINVTEEITVNWFEDFHHGIYKFTPQWSKYTGKNGKTIKRKSKILNLSSTDPYSIDYVKKKARIKIGNPNTYEKLGQRKYTINYIYDMGKDPFHKFDEFIFHAFGDYWGTEIKNPSIEVIMPKPIGNNKINFFVDKYRQENVTDVVDYEINNNKLTAHFNSDKYKTKKHEEFCSNPKNIDENGKCKEEMFLSPSLYKSLTVDIELPDKYFTGGSWNYGFGSLIISLIAIAFTVYTFFKWKKYGKDFEKRVSTIEFYPPDNLDSAEVGYIYNKKKSTKKLTISLIVELASKGYLRIDNCGKEIKITNLKTTNDLIKTSEKEIKQLQKNSEISELEMIVYSKLFETSNEIILSKHPTFYQTFETVDKLLKYNFKNKIHDWEATKKMRTTIFEDIILLILTIISYTKIEDLDPRFGFLYYLAFACVLINLFFAIIMKRKTKYGEIISAKVKGFKQFLETAEKDQLEDLVEKNPQYFYNILPYTYVLGISKKWIKKFENISYPEMDMGNFNYKSDREIYNLYEETSYPQESSRSGSGGCSSCGGGCSSCGGGCSSCGGGGSW